PPLPDRHHFVFVRNAGPETGVYIGSLARPEEQTSKRVLRDSYGAIYVADPDAGFGRNRGFILFVRGGALMAQGFAAEKLELTGEAIPVAENLANPYSFSASKDGKL